MGKDDFWLGVGAGVIGSGLVLYGAWRLHVASYERGWNGEELESQNLLGILGWTKSGALVLIPSFNSGKYDREVKLSLELHASSINSIAKETRYVIDELNKLEQETKKQLETGISPEDKNFLKELHNIAKTELTKPQPNFRQSKSYVA